jgi:uncharacterized protein
LIRADAGGEDRAMSTPALTEPVTTVQRIYAAFGEGDIPGLLSQIHEDVEWSYDVTAPGADLVPMLRTHRGHEGVQAYLAGVAQLEMLAFEPARFLVDGQTVLVQLRIHIRHPETGKDIDLDEIHRWEAGDDGRIVRYRSYSDTAGIIDIYRI